MSSILITNDDGIDAPGLATLATAARDLGHRVMVIGPSETLSGCSHRFTWDVPFRVQQRGDHRFVVHGTPADCVRVGLSVLAQDVDLILSGVNAGENLGLHNTLASGTVAAVREGVLLGTPGIALSHDCVSKSAINWQRALAWTREVLPALMDTPVGRQEFLSVNLPNLDDEHTSTPPVVHCPLDESPLPMPFRRDGEVYQWAGDYRHRPLAPEHDIDMCFRGHITVTRQRISSGC